MAAYSEGSHSGKDSDAQIQCGPKGERPLGGGREGRRKAGEPLPHPRHQALGMRYPSLGPALVALHPLAASFVSYFGLISPQWRAIAGQVAEFGTHGGGGDRGRRGRGEDLDHACRDSGVRLPAASWACVNGRRRKMLA